MTRCSRYSLAFKYLWTGCFREGGWEKFLHGGYSCVALKSGHEHGCVGWTELGEDLATGAARVQRFFGIGDHNHSGDGARSFGDGFEYGGSFSAVGESETGVFDICAGEDESVCEYRCADMES